MIETNDIKNYAKNMFTRSKSTGKQEMMNPNREWFILCMVFLLIFISGAWFVVWQYQTYSSLSSTIEVSRDMTIPQYQESRVLDVHEYFSQRGEQYELLLGQDNSLSTTTVPEPDTEIEEEDIISEDTEVVAGEVEDESIDDISVEQIQLGE